MYLCKRILYFKGLQTFMRYIKTGPNVENTTTYGPLTIYKMAEK